MEDPPRDGWARFRTEELASGLDCSLREWGPFLGPLVLWGVLGRRTRWSAGCWGFDLGRSGVEVFAHF